MHYKNGEHISKNIKGTSPWYYDKHIISFPAFGILLFSFYIFTLRWFVLYLQIRAFQAIIVSFALVLVMIGLYKKRSFFLKLTVIDYLWFPAIAVIIINIFAVDYTDYYRYLFVYSAGFAFILLTKVNIREYFVSLVFMIAAAVIYALGSVTQYLFTDNFNKFIFNFTTPFSRESIAGLVARNYYPGFGFGKTAVAAGYISTGIGILINYYRNNEKIIQKILMFCSLIVLLIGLTITGKRSVLLWTVVATSLTYYITGSRSEKRKRAKQAMVLLGVFIMFLIIILLLPDLPPFLKRFSDLLNGILTGRYFTDNLRILSYGDAWSVFLINPLFGVGWLQYMVYSPTGIYMHNIYLQLLAETGIIGFTLIIIPIAYTYIKTYRSIHYLSKGAAKTDPLWIKGLAISFYYQTFFLLFGLFDIPLNEETYILMYFFSVSMINSFIVYHKEHLLIK